MKTIKDAIHGSIEINEIEERLLGTEEMQRLRRVKQLAMAPLVYPGANHTRFEHSIGTMKMAGDMAEAVGISGERRRMLRIAALLHDVGHSAFSHESEEVIKRIAGTHEEIGEEKIKRGKLGEIVSENYSLKKLLEIYNGNKEGQLTAGDIGADRIDYLLRDSKYTGVAYGVIDYDRIVGTLSMKKGKPAVVEGGLEAVESMLIARFLMFSTVYFHKTSRIASAMLRREIERALRNGLEIEKVTESGDWELLSILLEMDETKEIAGRIAARNLYKQAFVFERGMLGRKEERMAAEGKLGKTLSSEIGADVVVDYPVHYESMHSALIYKGGKLYPIDEISDLVRSLESTERKRRKIIVACDGKHLKKVKRACRKVVKR